MYPIQHGPSVPYEVMVPHEHQCQRNHSQTIDRIAERGGFDPAEAWAVVNGLDYYKEIERGMGHAEACRRWVEYAARINLHYAQLEQSMVLLNQAQQLLVTAANAGEYGTGPECAKRYATWQEAVRVLGVKG